MTAITDLIDRCDAWLKPERFEDYGPNGLQVPGRPATDVIATGVSASAELFERAAAEGAGLVLVHHGLFWRGMPQEIDVALHRRLVPLFEHRIALGAYHLPLDAHPEIGNNALLAEALGASRREPAFAHRGEPIGLVATLPEPVAARELVASLRAATGGREPLHLAFGPELVRTVGVVTGGGADHLGEAIARGLDAFVTGEPAERVMTQAREGAIHLLAGGHYATETAGIRALGDRLARECGVRHVFLDDPNPI
jgi:dinuclear metal center YbgI/SA1388 family protein